jgi:hypothetical protein
MRRRQQTVSLKAKGKGEGEKDKPENLSLFICQSGFCGRALSFALSLLTFAFFY